MRKNNPKSYDYIEKLAGAETELMAEARKNSEMIGLGAISISSAEAQLIKFHLKSINALKVVEIGTLTGLSALHILQAMPSLGHLITLEKSKEHADLAEKVLQTEIQKSRCRIVFGDARDNLDALKGEGPFDAVFIDGNKAAYLDYYNWALENTRVEGLIFVDNIFLDGAVWGEETKQKFGSKQIQSVQQMNQLAFTQKNLDSTIIPTEEGLLITRKLS